MTNDIIAIIGAISASGGVSGILGAGYHIKTKKVENYHKKYKTDLDIKVAKLEQKVYDLDREFHGDVKEIKADIHYIRTKLEE